jgi:nucleoid DNA-binding protein
LAGSRRGTGDFNRKERKEHKGKAGSTTSPMKKSGLAVRRFSSGLSLRSLRSLR